MVETSPDYIRTLAQRCTERADALNWKGKRGDDAALNYWLGAAMGMRVAGDEARAKNVEQVGVWVIAIRGMIEVRMLAKG